MVLAGSPEFLHWTNVATTGLREKLRSAHFRKINLCTITCKGLKNHNHENIEHMRSSATFSLGKQLSPVWREKDFWQNGGEQFRRFVQVARLASQVKTRKVQRKFRKTMPRPSREPCEQKPPYSYKSLTAIAICSSCEKTLPLGGIYRFIMANEKDSLNEELTVLARNNRFFRSSIRESQSTTNTTRTMPPTTPDDRGFQPQKSKNTRESLEIVISKQPRDKIT